MSSRLLPPRLPPLSAKKSAVLSVLDIGTSKIVCLVAKLNPSEPPSALCGRTHSCRILGIGHQRSRGIKGGVVVDMDAAEAAIRFAVDAAERMAGVQIESVIVNATGGRLASKLYGAKTPVAGRAVTQADVHRVLEACTASGTQPGRAVLHSLPIAFSLDETRHIQDPRGMVGDVLCTEMNLLSCDGAAARNLLLSVERCHLSVDAIVATPYASALSSFADDEAELGTVLIDMGAGTTSVSVFSGGHLAHVDSFAVGGHHVTMDVARGLGITVTDAERLKTLYGACLASVSDESETIAVVPAGEDCERPSHLPKAQLISIIRPRVEEILELLRDRLKNAGLPHAGRRLVLTGGACQLTGMQAAVKRIVSGQVRIGRPLGIKGLPESAKNPAFAASVGLLIYPQVSGNEHYRPSRRPALREAKASGYIGRVGQWLFNSF
jgi:cell division protein FtsA